MNNSPEHRITPKRINLLAGLLYKFRSLRIWVKITLPLTVLALVAGALINYWNFQAQRSIALRQSLMFSESMHNLTIAGISTLMIVADPESLSDYLSQINHIEGVRNLHVISSNVNQKGLEAGARKDPIEEQVLASGKMIWKLREEGSSEYLRVVRPILNSKNYLGQDCTSCHEGPENSVLGAVSMDIPLDQVNSASSDFSIQFVIAIAVIIAGLIGTLFFAFRYILTNPLTLITSRMDSISKGDLTKRFHPQSVDDIGTLLGEINTTVVALFNAINEIKESSDKSIATSAVLADTAATFTVSAQSLATTSQETAAALEELTTSSDSVAASMKQTAQNTRTINENAVKLNVSIADVGEAMKNLAGLAGELTDRARGGGEKAKITTQAMQEVRQSSDQIQEITKMISEISDRTNLLSLNAAIEAARAGESGRGFAVVADEISKLADRTARNVKEINSLVASTSKAVNKGIEVVGEETQILQDITKSVALISEASANVLKSLEEQGVSTKTIFQNIEKLAESTIKIELATDEQKKATYEISNSIQSVSQEAQAMSEGSLVIQDSTVELVQIAELLQAHIKHFKLTE